MGGLVFFGAWVENMAMDEVVKKYLHVSCLDCLKQVVLSPEQISNTGEWVCPGCGELHWSGQALVFHKEHFVHG